MIARDRMRRVDAAWLHMDRPENTADIVALLSLDGRVRFDRIRRLVEARLLPHPRFRQRIADPGFPSGPAWEADPRFSLDRHLHRERLPDDPAALTALVSDVATARLEADRPPWRLWVVDRPKGGSALVVKVHHCVGDGFALVALLLALADERGRDPGAVAQRAFRDLSLLRGPAALARAALSGGRAALAALEEPLAFGRSLWKMATLPAAPPTSLSRPLTGIRRAAFSRGFPLLSVRRAARRAGVTVNELLLAALSGALRAELARAGDPVDLLSLRALVPVNLRSRRPDATQAAGPANQFGLVFQDLPVGLSAPAARLAAVRESAAAVKASPDALVALAILGALGLAPAAVERLGTDFFSRKASLVVTNVPGPRRPLRLAGHTLDRMMFWVPHPAALGLGVSFLSYAGELDVGVRADAAVLPEPERLVAGFEEELVVLAPEAAGRARRTRPVNVPVPLPVPGAAPPLDSAALRAATLGTNGRT